jgi:hypothetical protein
MPDLARLYDLHAEHCARSAERSDNPRDRAMLIKLVDGGGRPHKNYDNHKSSPLQGSVGRTVCCDGSPLV